MTFEKKEGRIPLAGKTRVDEKTTTTRLAKSEKSKTKRKKKKER